MANELQTPTEHEHKHPISIGARLKSARESLGLERKDVAAQLRLNEKIIIMMEKERYPVDLPTTFIRGYVRAYGKFLQLSENDIKNALDNIKHKQTVSAVPHLTPYKIEAVTSGNYFMQLFTSLIVVTLLALAGIWWYTHNFSLSQLLPTENIPTLKSDAASSPEANDKTLTNAPAPDNNASQAAEVVTPQADATSAKDLPENKSVTNNQTENKSENKTLENKRPGQQNTATKTNAQKPPAYTYANPGVRQKQTYGNHYHDSYAETDETETPSVYAD